MIALGNPRAGRARYRTDGTGGVRPGWGAYPRRLSEFESWALSGGHSEPDVRIVQQLKSFLLVRCSECRLL